MNIENLLAVWERRPSKVLEFGNEEDWAYILEILPALKNAIPEIEVAVNSTQTENALPSALNRNPQSGVSSPPNASEGILERNEPWRPRWEREDVTSQVSVLEAPAVSTPSNVLQSSPAEAPNNRSLIENPSVDGSGEVSGQTADTLDKPESVSSKLAAARRVAAKSKAPSSRSRREKKTKVTASTLP